MQIIKPSFHIIEQESGLEGIYKIAEKAGRTCYKSENLITEDSAETFVDRLIKSGHLSVLEHGTVYLCIPDNFAGGFNKLKIKYEHNPYTRVKIIYNPITKTNLIYISTNMRVIVENNWLDDLKYLCEPTKFHVKRVVVNFISDIHFYKDITRHRKMSYAIESTRFCNYIKEKFSTSVSFINPIWLKEEERQEFEEDLKVVENLYFKWINKGWQAQQAAYFLIQGTKADIIMSGFVDDFKHVFNLRTSKAVTGKAHPTVIELFDPLYKEFIKRKLITE